MDVEFTRLPHQQCRATAVRADGATVTTTTTAKHGIPHDLEHLVIDRFLGIPNGFWECVWKGAEFSTLQVETVRARKRPRAHNRGLTKEFNGLSELLGAWVGGIFNQVVGAGWVPGEPLPRHDEIAALLRRPDLRSWIDADRLQGLCEELHQARRTWMSLPEGRSMRCEWLAVH
jgi:hypothetical protein